VPMGRLHFRQKRGQCVESCLKDEDRLTFYFRPMRYARLSTALV
jgi:hypothetical protein